MKIHYGFNVPPKQSQTDTAGTSWTWGGAEDDEANEAVALVYYYENKQRLNFLMPQLKFPFPPVCL